MVNELTLESFLFILSGTWITIVAILGSMLLGFILGVPMGTALVYGPKPVRMLVGLYVWFFRGIPLLVMLLLVHFGVFLSLGFSVPPLLSTCVVLGLVSGSYQSQIFKGALYSVQQGQLKAARALGMSDFEAMKTVMVPQAMRLAIPAWSNEYSILLKDSALAYCIGTPEIMSRAQQISTSTEQHFLVYAFAGVCYFLITLAGVRCLRSIEKRVRIPGYTSAGML